jgi:hypothetical protein
MTVYTEARTSARQRAHQPRARAALVSWLTVHLLTWFGHLHGWLEAAWPRLRSTVMCYTGFGLISSAVWHVSTVGGLVASGLSLLILEAYRRPR